MNRLPIIIALVALAAYMLPACTGDDDNQDIYDAYEAWRIDNNNWLNELKLKTNADGTPYYATVVPNWNPQAYVLVHYFNDRSLTAGNLSPLSTSTVDVRYIGKYYNDVAFDSSYTQTMYGQGIARFALNEVIEGWTMAFETMHVGDSAEIVIPYQSAYGASTSAGIVPYSNLKFNVKLVDIPFYEVANK